ncbi:MAG: DUF2851 family protein [Roseivirga sp.]|nr:DUF2851 family protein [Roseivirga sp.]
MIQEAFLYFLWKYQYFNIKNLTTTSGESVSVTSLGIRNGFAGPDFKEARVTIDGIQWAGAVEMHVRSSDWFRHGHQNDLNYENVVLHVVWEDDKAILLADDTVIPTIEMKDRVKPEVLRRYRYMVESRSKIPCDESLKKVKAITRLSMVERVLVARVQEKAAVFTQLLEGNEHDWEETAYQWLIKGFGFKTNAENMLALAASLPLKVLQKHRNQAHQIEALLFGQSGFLDVEIKDEYPAGLQKEYRFLKNKYGLKNKVHYNSWHFTKVRPGNYPTVRLAQLAGLLTKFPHIFSFFSEISDFNTIMADLEVKQSAYWTKHYAVDKSSKRQIGVLSRATKENLIINTTVPFLTAFAKARDNQAFLEKALNLLTGIPAERNHITELWQRHGWNVSSAFDSQGLIQLYNQYCTQKRCIECSIGLELIDKPNNLT